MDTKMEEKEGGTGRVRKIDRKNSVLRSGRELLPLKEMELLSVS